MYTPILYTKHGFIGVTFLLNLAQVCRRRCPPRAMAATPVESPCLWHPGGIGNSLLIAPLTAHFFLRHRFTMTERKPSFDSPSTSAWLGLGLGLGVGVGVGLG